MTQLDSAKLQTVAAFVKFMKSADAASILDQTIAHQMLREGIRKLHDNATSSRGTGKYLGHTHWSYSALKIVNSKKKIGIDVTSHLSHEHVVPVNVVISKLMSLKATAKIEDIEKVIRDFSIVAIITRGEDELLRKKGLGKKMPLDWDHADIWARYRKTELLSQIDPHVV